MTPEILKREAGRYALLKIGERYFARVECGSAARYVLNIPITPEQAAAVMDDDDLLDQLVGSVAFAPDRYAGQHVPLAD